MTSLVENTTAVEEEKRALASVQRIVLVDTIPNCDLIVIGEVLGYRVIVKSSDFPNTKVGDETGELCVFFEPDSILDQDDPQLAFLKSTHWRIRSLKIRGVCSQGLAMPLSLVQSYGVDSATLKEGDNLTKELRVRKYVSPEECAQYCDGKSPLDPSIRRTFPSDVNKTDEPNIQSYKWLFKKLFDAKTPVTITEKIDGCSATYWAGGLASRNYELVSDKVKDLQSYFEIDHRFKLREKMAKYPDFALQGEIAGPSICGNRLALSTRTFQVFNVWNRKKGCYLEWDEVKRIAAELGVPTVPVLFENKTLEECGFRTWRDMMDFANPRRYRNEKTGKDDGSYSEGLVCKGFVDGKMISFKVVSQNYLMQKDRK